jgi:hypothetical protein
MKCPHCGTAFFDTPDKQETIPLGKDADGSWRLIKRMCPSCTRMILHLQHGQQHWKADGKPVEWDWVYMGQEEIVATAPVRPRSHHQPPCPPEVPQDLAQDYVEACMILSDSPKASAALSRQCLQRLLRDHGHVAPTDLQTEIECAIESRVLPSYLAETLRTIARVGNFAACPGKKLRVGEIAPVEPGEPEWNIITLESLFDYFFVAPEAAKRKTDEFRLKHAPAKSAG